MSRIAFAAALVAMAAAPAMAETADPGPAYATYMARTSAEPDCRRSPAGEEIVICGRRDADRYRVPFTQREAGDPRGEGVASERARLQHITTPCQNQGPFLIGCGMAGVTVGIDLGAGSLKRRPLAP